MFDTANELNRSMDLIEYEVSMLIFQDPVAIFWIHWRVFGAQTCYRSAAHDI